jgi:site-specific DNA recombinase
MKKTRCAIYTRKSSEEGLEQDFNSLAAQREACEAYIKSQRAEGWVALPTQYDDGGISGGTLERPALHQLMADIEADLIDHVILYKIDRLTRSLTDFSKLIDRFDKKGVSMVSVSQPFDTSTSMGRLTLNVLLSFAQFEREITGERIRDKIAASKQRGMWMGGCVPLGYDLQERKLLVNETEAQVIQHIFARYLELGSVHHLRRELERDGIRSKVRIRKNDQRRGGQPLSRGALYPLLRNRLYIGEVTHKAKSYPGLHKGIVDPTVFDAVQTLLEQQRRSAGRRGATTSLLAGKLFDGEGCRLSPSHSTKGNKRYRYYVSQAVLYGERGSTRSRWPAEALEQFICEAITERLQNPNPWLTAATQIDADEPIKALAEGLPEALTELLEGATLTDTECTLRLHQTSFDKWDIPASDLTWTVPLAVQTCHNGRKRIIRPDMPTEPNEALINALVDAHRWYKLMLNGQSLDDIAETSGRDKRHIKRILHLNYLAPDLKQAILEGRQPMDMALQALTKAEPLPLVFADQRKRWRATL